jgi:hypothetical protein
MNRFVALAGLMIGTTSAAFGATTVSTFDAFTPGGMYESWATATTTSGTTSYTVDASGFGGLYQAITLDASAETKVQLDLTVNSGPTLNAVVVLIDADGTEYGYRWYNLTTGNKVLDLDLSPVPNVVPNADSYVANAGSTAGLDLAKLTYFHVQIDPHVQDTPYSISLNDLQLTSVPEPGSLGLLGLGLPLAWARRRRA